MPVNQRMRAPALAVAMSLLAGLAIAGPAWADAAPPPAVSPEGAAALQRQLGDWLANLLGTPAHLGEPAIQVTAEAGHYSIQPWHGTSLGTALGMTFAPDQAPAQLTPLAGGLWAVDRDPMPFTATMQSSPTGGDVTYTVASFSEHAVLDPSLATPSHADVTVTGYRSSLAGSPDGGTGTASIDDINLHLGWAPAGDGRIDVTEADDTHLLAMNLVLPGPGPVSISVAKAETGLRADRVAPDRLASLIRAAIVLKPVFIAVSQSSAASQQHLRAFVESNRAATEADRRAAQADRQSVAAGTMSAEDSRRNSEQRRARAQERLKAFQAEQAAAAATRPPATPDQKAAMHDALIALTGLLDGFAAHSTFSDMRVVASGKTFHLERVSESLDAAAPGGTLVQHLKLAFDGLDSADVPAGILREFLPRHFVLAERTSGVPAAGLRDLLLRAADANAGDPAPSQQALALLTNGHAVFGLDELALDAGPLALKGTGELRLTGPNQSEGEAHITATGLDEMIRQSTSMPELARAVPVLFLLKGIGRQDGATTVWNIAFHDKHVLVNGQDLAAMLPGK